MGGIFSSGTKRKTTFSDVERALGIDNNVNPKEVDALMARIGAKIKIEDAEEDARKARVAALEKSLYDLKFNSVPTRRMRLRKTAAKRKTVSKSRSQYAKKNKKVARKTKKVARK